MKTSFKRYSLISSTLAFLFLGSFRQVTAQSRQDSLRVSGLVNGVTNHFVNNQMDSFATLWDDKATFITIAGMVAKGKAKIVDMHSLAKYIIDSSTAIKLQPPIINFADKDLAIAYSVWDGLVFKIKGQTGPVQSGYLTCVLQRKNGNWKIISATNATNGSYEKSLAFTEYTHAMWKMLGIDE